MRRAGGAVGHSIQSHPRWWLGAFTLAYLAVTLVNSQRPLWYDELLTESMSHLPNLPTIWAALKEGADLNPPLLYLATKFCYFLFGNSETATRLPAICGFLAMCWSIYAFVARRCPRSYAFAAMLLPVMTSGFRYSVEARSYGLEFGFLGIGLVAWQRATEPNRRWWHVAILYVSLVAALLMHCYAVVALIPFFVAQAVRDWLSKSVDRWIWVSWLALSPVLLVYAPLLQASRNFIVSNPIFAPTGLSVPVFYALLLKTTIWSIAVAWFFVATKRVATERVATERVATKRLKRDACPPIPVHEQICAAVFFTLPVFSFLLAVGVTGIFVPRYGMVSMIGLGIWFAFSMYKRCAGTIEKGGEIVVVFLAGILIFGGASLVRGFSVSPGKTPDLMTVYADLPIVVSNGLMFLEGDRYERAEVAHRLRFLTDEPAALRYTGSNVFDRGYVLIEKWFPLRGKVESYAHFIGNNREFVVYGTTDFPMDWLIRGLRDQGFRLQTLSAQPGRYGEDVLLLATAP